MNYQPEDTKIKPWFPIGPLCPHKDDLSERRATGYMFRKSSKVPGGLAEGTFEWRKNRTSPKGISKRLTPGPSRASVPSLVEHLLKDYFLSAGRCHACSHRSQCTGIAKVRDGC